MVQRTTTAAIDKAVMPITAARKRWDAMTPLAWSNKNRNKNKNKNKNKNRKKSTTVAATSPSMRL